MSQSGGDRSAVYAAAQGRTFLAGELKNKPNEWIREFAGLVDDKDTLDFLNHYCSIYEERGMDFLDTHMGRQVLQQASTRMMDDAFRAGNVSQMQGAVGLTNSARDGGDLLSEAAARLANEGAIGLVLGPPGSGKTATTLDVARVWAARTGGAVIGNTGWDGYDEVVRSDRELLETMAHIQGPVLAIIDETAQELSGFGEGSKKAEQFSNSLTFVRKKEESHGPYAKKGSVLMVNHTRTKTAKAFRDLCSFAIEKPRRDDPGYAVLLDSEGGKDRFEESDEFKGLTDTRERYDEHEPSEFRIIGADGSEESEDGPSPEDVAKDTHIETVLRACLIQGQSYPDAADLVPYKDSWVGNRVREWRRGDYRDLLSEDEVDEMGKTA